MLLQTKKMIQITRNLTANKTNTPAKKEMLQIKWILPRIKNKDAANKSNASNYKKHCSK